MISTRRSTSMWPVNVSPEPTGSWIGIGLLGEPVANHRQAAVEVRSDPVHLVGEDETGDPVAIRLAPHGLGLGLDAGHGIQQGHRAVQHAERALHFDGEVHVTRGIDDVDPVRDAVPGPEAGSGGGGDGDPALLLLLHPVHGGRALVDLTDLVVLAGVVKDALGGSRLAGIDVGHDADIPVPIEGCLSGHVQFVSRPTKKRGDRPGRFPWYRSAHIRAFASG